MNAPLEVHCQNKERAAIGIKKLRSRIKNCVWSRRLCYTIHFVIRIFLFFLNLYLSLDKKILAQEYHRFFYKNFSSKTDRLFFASNFKEIGCFKKIQKYNAERNFCNFRNILRSGFWGQSSLFLISLAKKYHEGF